MSPHEWLLTTGAVALVLTGCGHDAGQGEPTCERALLASAGPTSSPVCLSPPSTLSDGSSICRAFVTSQSPVCACSAPGRRPAREQGCRVRLLGGDAPHDACICELTQLTSGALARCLADESASDDGWCYTTLTPTCGPAASERVGAVCPSGNWLKLQGGAALAEGETLFLACPAARIECD